MNYTFKAFGTGSGFSYIVKGPNGYIHQPSKLWRTLAMATSAAKRAVKRKEAGE